MVLFALPDSLPVVGYRSLLIVIAALYGLAFIAGRRHLRPGELVVGDQRPRRWALTART
ncbi:MAG: hypothetical protein ACM3ML_15250 [Micromonosporaceae bacterium]